MKKCPKCGKVYDNTWGVCFNDSTKLVDREEVEIVIPPKAKFAETGKEEAAKLVEASKTLDNKIKVKNEEIKVKENKGDTLSEMKKDLGGWGIGLIVVGIISNLIPDFFSAHWGIITILLGIIILVFRNRAMYILLGVAMFVVGFLNIIAGNSGWIIFGFFQFYWGFQVIQKFWKYKNCIGRVITKGKFRDQTADIINSKPISTQTSLSKEISQGKTKKCPKCAEEIKLEAIICRFCGYKFDGAEVQAKIEEMKANIKKKEEYVQTQNSLNTNKKKATKLKGSFKIYRAIGIFVFIVAIFFLLMIVGGIMELIVSPNGYLALGIVMISILSALFVFGGIQSFKIAKKKNANFMKITEENKEIEDFLSDDHTNDSTSALTETGKEKVAYSLISEAGCLEVKGEFDDALLKYQDVVTKFRDTAAGKDAEININILRAKLKDMLKCPQCKKVYDNTWEVCFHCRCKLVEALKLAKRQNQGDNEEIKVNENNRAILSEMQKDHYMA